MSEFNAIQPTRVWEAAVEPGRRYHLQVSADAGVRVRLDHLAAAVVVEWLAVDESDPSHRGYLLPTSEEWSGEIASPDDAKRVRVKLYFWKQIAPAPPTSIMWRFAMEDIGPIVAPQYVRFAVAHQAVQYPPTIEGNTAVTLESIRQAGRQRVQLLCLSENFLGRNVPLPLEERSMTLDHPAIRQIRDAVAEAGIYATFAFPEKAVDGRYHVTAPLIGPDGAIAGVYRKQFLTQVELENGVSPGTESPVFTTPFGRIGIVICYDFWYPETVIALAKNGANIICHPLAGDGLKPHWDYGWRARAIDHQSYVLSSVTHDCGGKTPSRIVAPDGDLLAETWIPNQLAIADVRVPWTQDLFWFSVGPALSDVRNVMDATRMMHCRTAAAASPIE